MSKSLIHAVLLILCVVLAFTFVKTPLLEFDLQIIAFLFIVLYLSKKYYIPQHAPSHLLESVVFTFVVLVITLTTGGAYSPFFFLLHFLIFALSLFLEPLVGISVTASIMIFFLLTTPSGDGLRSFIPILSLGLLSPFALFMGQLYLENQKAKVQTQKLEEDTYLFHSLVLKNHIKKMKEAVDDYMGEQELHEIQHQINRMEKLLEKYEQSI